MSFWATSYLHAMVFDQSHQKAWVIHCGISDDCTKQEECFELPTIRIHTFAFCFQATFYDYCASPNWYTHTTATIVPGYIDVWVNEERLEPTGKPILLEGEDSWESISNTQAHWAWCRCLNLKAQSQWHISFNKSAPPNPSNSPQTVLTYTNWGPRTQIFEPVGIILIHTTNGHNSNTKSEKKVGEWKKGWRGQGKRESWSWGSMSASHRCTCTSRLLQ